MTNQLSMILGIAVKTIRGHRTGSAALVLIIAAAAFVTVFGISLLSSIESAMRNSIASSVTGDVQVWSSEAPDTIQLFDLGQVEPDFGEIPDFAAVESRLTELQHVETVVPMAIGSAAWFRSTEVDHALERLNAAWERSEETTTADSRAHFERIRRRIQTMAKRLREAAEQHHRTDPEDLQILKKVESEIFWDRFPESPKDSRAFLETRFASVVPSPRPLFINYVATDPEHYFARFDRIRIVDGRKIPANRRGILLSKRFYESQVKLDIARRFDRIIESVQKGRSISNDTALSNQVEQMVAQHHQIVDQLTLEEQRAVGESLRGVLETQTMTDLSTLLQQFLEIDDENALERKAFFDDVIASQIKLYAVEPGEELVLQGFTRNGFPRSVEVRLWGTFEYEGLESSTLAGSNNIIDLATFRQLYGKMTEEDLAEVRALRESVGLRDVESSDAEDQLFGGGAEESTVDNFDDPSDEIPNVGFDDLGSESAEGAAASSTLDDRVADGEFRRGVVINAAVFVDELKNIESVIESINGLEDVQATNWRQSAGTVGQFVSVMTVALYVLLLIILVVTTFILNTTTVMATMARIPEYGTIRAIGGSKTVVFSLVLAETAIISSIAALVGSLTAFGAIAWLNSVGIPATSGIGVFLFGGSHLYPVFEPVHLVSVFALIVGLTLVSTLYPAWMATRVDPIAAMGEI